MRRFHDELAPHFAIEEQHLLPAVEQSGGADLAKRTRDEHAELRLLVSDDPQDVLSRLDRFGTLLRDHVRFEERELFAFTQETLDDQVLEAVANAYRARRSGAPPREGTTPS